jgi:hypothetical protein
MKPQPTAAATVSAAGDPAMTKRICIALTVLTALAFPADAAASKQPTLSIRQARETVEKIERSVA